MVTYLIHNLYINLLNYLPTILRTYLSKVIDNYRLNAQKWINPTQKSTTMSIFKVKQWWSNEGVQGVENNEGTQSATCLKVDKFNSHSDSDCVLVGEGTLLKIYKPNQEQNASDILLESQLGEPILQIETGKFIAGSEDRHILVLHPQSYAVYQLHRKEGHTDAGDQNQLKPALKHFFTRKAYSSICGPFGNNKTRDFLCIQSIDGSLSFFDQETFLFMYMFNDVIIPGPVAYIANSDSFVICKSTWVLEIHSYQQLREFSELNVRQNRKNVPQWVYNAGEEISCLQIIQTSSNFSSIIALGERHLCCFQDNGLMKYMIKFDFMPICFHAYIIGWYYEPAARLLVSVASADSKMFIYEGTTLLWSCDLLHNAIAISRCFLKYLPGGIVTLSPNGVVCVSYLGTLPDLNANAAPMTNDTLDLEQVQTELETVEESLQKILEGREDADNRYQTIDQIVKIKADVGKPVQNLYQEITQDSDLTLHLLMCPIVVILSCEDPKQIKSAQITYSCSPPFVCSEQTLCLDRINGTEIIETQVFLGNEADISETIVKIMFTITDADGKIYELTSEILLPLSLYCLLSDFKADNELKLYIDTNYPIVDFNEIITDFSKEDLFRHGNSNEITFSYRSTKKTVALKAIDKQYSVEAKDTPEITSLLIFFMTRLKEHFVRNNLNDFRLTLKFDEEFTKQLTHKFLKSIESHAKERIKLKSCEEELDVLQKQFTVVQKRLLVQYGSLPPGDCDPLEFLMKDTHKKIIKTANEILQYKETVCKAGSTLTAAGHLMIYIFKLTVSDKFKVKLIEEMFTLGSLYEDYQEWEESVSQALPYILNNVFNKSEKDKEKLASVTEQGILTQINLKRFMKQIKQVLDKMFSEAKGVDGNEDTKIENRITRIEEFVEGWFRPSN